jgi:UDP-N-acetylmuramyl pentapeptide phosphotransferase/UDP-N-acetylglucosamine-1-phosphate transferase
MQELNTGRRKLYTNLALIFGGVMVISAGLIWLLYPLLSRYALARPNARSSHRKPTPQGGGIAVIGATTIVVAAATILAPSWLTDLFRLVVTFACVIALAVVGAIDDLQPLEVVPRLLLQAVAVLVVIVMLPADLHISPLIPWWVERTVMFIAVLWFVNVVNFMDGIDWMTVVEVVPITAALTLFGLMGALPRDATLVSIALCGAIIGFAPFNRPVARLFLGDVGSLPIGLLLGWLLALLAGNGHLAAALLLPLYYLADATYTLVRRLVSGEPLMQAHRRHFYQQAIDSGLSVYQVVGRVFLLNVGLIAFAATTLLVPSQLLHAALLATGCLFVTLLLHSFARARKNDES